MAALSADRERPRKSFVRQIQLPCQASVTFYRNACVVWDASTADAKPAGTGTDTDDMPLGLANNAPDNSSGSSGDLKVIVDLFQPVECVVLGNDPGAGALDSSDLLSIVYFLDDQTVTSTSANNSKAGRLWKIDSDGCHVEMLRAGP